MSDSALTTQGLALAVGDGSSPESFTDISEIISFSGPDGSAPDVDKTDLSSSNRVFGRGLSDLGTLSFDIHYLPSNTQHAQLFSDFKSTSEQTRNYTLTYTNSPATVWTMSAFVNGFSVNSDVDSTVQATVTLRINSITES